jgi:DGQHR domain-containing protein
MSIEIPPITKSLIRVYGMAGTFHVGPDDQQENAIGVRYFNTVASGSDSTAAGNSRQLLEELKPMRERAKVSALRDLSSLLQRELDDARVAQDLVPYLQGARSKVGFFPGILVALVPKGFLEASDQASYPSSGGPTDGPREVTEAYADCWTLRRLKSGGEPISLGTLEIDPENADLVVLDGQHRANAFRYVTNTFQDASGDTIYASFYEAAGDIGAFGSELPVTILWFEANGTLDPKLLSRQLFVDVNTNARPVSESRNILLDDRQNASIVVGAIYKLLAARGFDTDAFSLLHGGFDCEEGEQHPLALLLPVHFRYALSYFAFGDDKYDTLSVSLNSNAWRGQKNYTRALRLMMGVTEGDFIAAGRGDKAAVTRLNDALLKDFVPAILELLEGFELIKAHVDASALMEALAMKGSSQVRETWHKVFCGGEGLYGAFKRSKIPSPRARDYLDAIKEVEGKFVGERAGLFKAVAAKDVRTAYLTFASKAGLTGFLMAASAYCDEAEDGWEARGDFITTLAKLPKDRWANVLGVYKPEVVAQLDPKLWPDIRNIFLRVIQELEPAKEFFSVDELTDGNPDAKLLWNNLRSKYQAFRNSLALEERDVRRPDTQTIAAWRDEAIVHLKATLAACGLKPLLGDNALQIYCINRIDQLIPDKDVAGPEPTEDDEDEDAEDDDEG